MWGVCETNREGTAFLMPFIPCLPARAALSCVTWRGQGSAQVLTVGLDYLGVLLAVKIAAR